jgi:hypothetical protein
LVSDDAGRAEYLVDAGREYRLSAAHGNGQRTESRLLSVPELFVGEVRTLRVELGTLADLVWWGRAIDGETELPLRDAAFAVLHSEPTGSEVFQAAHRSGDVEAAIATWNHEVVAVRSPGYATAFVLPSAAHRTREDPQRVLLWREATLEVRVEGGTAVPRVSVWTEHYERIQSEGMAWVGWDDSRWRGSLRADGTHGFEGLPAKVELTVEAKVAGRVSRRERLVLEPGERLEVVWSLGSGATIEGHALDPQGQPVSGLEMWMLADNEFGRTFQAYHADEVLAQVTTEPDGSFFLSDLAPGDYMVGPSPRVPFDEDLADRVPVGTPVTIGPEGGVVALTLTIWRGLTIRGRVLGSDGEGASGAHVFASGVHTVDADVRADGSFSLPGLMPGAYRVSASDVGGGDADSPAVEALAGDEGVQLHLRAGGRLSVRMTDAGGQPATDAELELVPWKEHLELEELSLRKGARSDASGEAHFSGVLPGTYAVLARVGGKLALATDLVIDVSSALEVDLVLAAAVPLKVRQSLRDPAGGFRVRWGGRVLEVGAFDGLEAEVLLPPGDVTVEPITWNSEQGHQLLQEKRLHLVLGKPATVVFDALSEPR